MINSRDRERREEVSFRILRLLSERPEYSQREMAAALDISLGGINHCLRALVQKGLVKIESLSASAHKLGYCHILTPSGTAERMVLAAVFLRRKLAEYEALKIEIEALESEIGSLGRQEKTGARACPPHRGRCEPATASRRQTDSTRQS